MAEPRTGAAYALAAIAGIVLWLLAGLASGRREPWDDGLYWTVFYPLALAVSGVLGYAFPERPWRWPLVVFLAQFPVMTLRAGELGNLWPLGLAVLAVLSMPGMAIARVASRLRAGRPSR